MGRTLRTSTDISLVAAQLLGWSLLVLISDMEVVITTPYLLVIVGAGLLLMTASAVQLGRSYSSLTRPRASAVLVRKGIYRYVRHPIYTGFVIVSLAFLLSRPTFPSGPHIFSSYLSRTCGPASKNACSRRRTRCIQSTAGPRSGTYLS